MRQAKSFAYGTLAYSATALFSLLAAVWLMQLWRIDWNIPLNYTGDALFHCMVVKAIRDNGWFLHNPYLGMPFGLDMQDFPFGDTFHCLILKFLASFCPTFGATINLYHLLGFPLAASTSLFVFRQFRLNYPAAMVGSILYAFLPYHFGRNEGHFFLGLYYLVPPIVLMTLWVADEKPAFSLSVFIFSEQGQKRFNTRLLGVFFLCLIIGLANLYYALFGIFFMIVLGCVAACHRRRLSPLLLTVVLITFLFCGVLLNIAPTLLYRSQYGANPEVNLRRPVEAELYGLKITQLLLPTTGHRLARFENLKNRYNDELPSIVENDMSALGIIGSLGFLMLLGSLFSKNIPRLNYPPYLLSLLNLASLLLAMVGGFSMLIALLLSPQIRAYNRICVFIAFFSLFVVVWSLDQFYHRFVVPRKAYFGYGSFLVLLLVVGLLDQATPGFAPYYRRKETYHQADYARYYQQLTQTFRQDAQFVHQIEAAVPPRTMIFQLPYVPFPENLPVHGMKDYQHLRAYLHSKTLRWSYGAMKRRRADLWQRVVVAKPVPAMVTRLKEAGFGGLWIDRAGYADQGAKLEAELSVLLGAPPLVSEDSGKAFFRLAQ